MYSCGGKRGMAVVEMLVVPRPPHLGVVRENAPLCRWVQGKGRMCLHGFEWWGREAFMLHGWLSVAAGPGSRFSDQGPSRVLEEEEILSFCMMWSQRAWFGKS